MIICRMWFRYSRERAHQKNHKNYKKYRLPEAEALPRVARNLSPLHTAARGRSGNARAMPGEARNVQTELSTRKKNMERYGKIFKRFILSEMCANFMKIQWTPVIIWNVPRFRQNSKKNSMTKTDSI